MPKRAKRAKVNDEPIILVDNPMKAKHAKPDVTEHGLCLANPCRVQFVQPLILNDDLLLPRQPVASACLGTARRNTCTVSAGSRQLSRHGLHRA